MQTRTRRLDTSALPLPERYSVSGRLCRPWLADQGEPGVRDCLLLLDQRVLIDRTVLTTIAEVARKHGFPRMRVTVEVLEDAAR